MAREQSFLGEERADEVISIVCEHKFGERPIAVESWCLVVCAECRKLLFSLYEVGDCVFFTDGKVGLLELSPEIGRLRSVFARQNHLSSREKEKMR